MSSTPLLEHTTEETKVQWVEVIPPTSRVVNPSSADLVIAIGKLRTLIEQGLDTSSITIDTDSFHTLEEDDIAAAHLAATNWDD